MTKPPSPRPLSIKVIAIFFMAGALPGPLVLFISARYATFAFLTLFLASLGVGIGLWRLSEIARRLAMMFVCFSAFSTLDLSRGATSLTWRSGVVLFWVVLCTISLWVLIKRKSAFIKPTQSP